MRRALVLCAGVLGVLLLASSAFADIHAVAEPSTQTVPINGTAADFDGSDSYAEDPPCPVTEWAWDFDGDSEDDYTENYFDPGGDGLTTYVYEKAGIFTCRLTVTDTIAGLPCASTGQALALTTVPPGNRPTTKNRFRLDRRPPPVYGALTHRRTAPTGSRHCGQPRHG